ncbi:MAG: DUF2330 domain-containing protein [Polyangiales bacterium]
MLRRSALALVTALSLPVTSSAFCGFYVSGSSEGLYNKATRAALMRSGTRTVLTMSNDYDGPPEDFAMVVPVPVVLSRESVRTLPHDVFEHLEGLTAPRLVEYWEQDPCRAEDRYEFSGDVLAVQQSLAGARVERDEPDHVRVEARFAVGEYDVVILSADESTGLERWLRANRYNIPRGASDALAPYVRGEWKFFVARVDIARTQRRPDGGARLSPLRMQYDSTEFRLPVRLGLLNAPPGPQDLIVYVLHPSARFEVANYRNVFIPTNLELAEPARDRFADVYGALFDATIQSTGQRSVVTEYAWSTGGCDPCPSPALDANDLATLGGDAITDFSGASMVVTRLHARYNASTLTDDLVFREALPVTGGHEAYARADGTLPEPDTGAKRTSSGNTFQARYVVRHPWTAPVTCDHPRRGVWGGPPGGARAQAVAARDVSNASREGVSLRSLVRTREPGVDLDARLTLPTAPMTAAPASIPATGVRRGCACAARPATTSAPTIAACVALVGAFVARRRARVRSRRAT